MSEDNKTVRESGDSQEYNKQATEYQNTPEYKTVAENKETAEVKEKAIDKLKKNPRMAAQAAIATSVIGVASFVVISTSGLVNVTMDGAINQITYQDNGVAYDITVSDVDKDNEVFFEVFNGSESLMKYTILFDHSDGYEGDLTGHFSLEEADIPSLLKKSDHLELDVHLCGDTGLVDRTYDSWTLEVNQFTSVFNSVTYGCDCSKSGCFKFQMDFNDDYGQFTDFMASITDSEGCQRTCTFTDDLHAEQSIFVMDLAGGDAVFSLTFHSGNEIVNKVYDTVI